MKPNIIYSHDLHSDSKTLFKNNDKVNTNHLGFTSERSFKNPLRVGNSHNIEQKKKSKIISPMISPKGNALNYHSQRTLLATPKLNNQNSSENMHKIISEKKANIEKTSQVLHNYSGSNNGNSNIQGTEVKSISYISSIRESNSSSVNNSARKKSGIDNSINGVSNTSTPHTLIQQRPYGYNETMFYKSYADNQIENSLNFDKCADISPVKMPQNSVNANPKAKGYSHIPRQDHLRKSYQSYSPNKFGMDQKNEIKNELLAKDNNKEDVFSNKILAEYIDNPMLIQFDNKEINNKDQPNGTKIMFNKDTYLTLNSEYLKGLTKNGTNGVHVKINDVLTTLNGRKDKILSPSIEAKFYSKSQTQQLSGSKEKLRFIKNNSRKLRDDSSISDENLSNKQKEIPKSNGLSRLENPQEEDEIPNTNHKIMGLSNNNTNNVIKSTNSMNYLDHFLLQDSTKEIKQVLKPDKSPILQIPHPKCFDYTSQRKCYSSSNSPTSKYIPQVYHRLSEDNQILYMKSDPNIIESNRNKDVETKPIIMLNDKKFSYLDPKIREKILYSDLVEKPFCYGISSAKTNNYTGIDKIYAETSKCKDSKPFELTNKQSIIHSKKGEKGVIYNVPTTSKSSSLGIKEKHKRNFGKVDSLTEFHLIPRRNEDMTNYNSISELYKTSKPKSLNEYSNNNNNENIIEDNGDNGRYGETKIGIQMKKTFQQMYDLLKNYKLKETLWDQDKAKLLDYIKNLEQRLKKYEIGRE